MHEKLAGFIHTTPSTIGMVESFMKKLSPDVTVLHMYNGLVKRDNFLNPIGVTPKSNLVRFAQFGRELQQAGCSVIACCCSLMPRATEYAALAVDVPFVQLDASIQQEAVEKYTRIGVVNTTQYVVPYVTEKLNDLAARMNKKIEIVFTGNTTALDLFNAGDFETHDRIVLEDMKALEARGVDCIFMGQIPFGLMETKVKAAGFNVPVLLTGETAFKNLLKLMKEQ